MADRGGQSLYVQYSAKHISCCVCSLLLQALEDELNQKKREQEMFFKLSEEADEQTPASPTKHAKFIPFSSTESS